ncbi:MAG: glutamine-hydrolyzing carbamoyl-phosphate synthase small subunit [Ignavibacteriae bacterium]|nr:glutamine-hydrolyzing carbamoyl-phosphate synthase small subunit [Ignavibacteriota bacterium]
MQKTKKIKLVLEDGSEYVGKSFGYFGSTAGEIVFNTAMTGYPESLTDPSYYGQILISTYPLIGNYGVPDDKIINGLPEIFESDKIQVKGFVISDYSFEFSHWNAKKSLSDWMKENKIPGIYGVDTRALTKKLREKGSMLGKIVKANEDVDFIDPNIDNLVAKVSTDEKVIYGNGRYKIVLVDLGVKNNIVRCLLKRDVTVIKVPWNYNFLTEDYDGLVISNGPGDPSFCKTTVSNISKAIIKEKPIFGICMGNQLLSLSAGAKIYKMKYGHRSHNQPVLQVGTDKCFITSQNHGFAVDDSKLNENWEPYFTNLNDGTCEGIKHKSKPFFSTQFHPEASSGPTDTEFLFDKFLDMVKKKL